MQSSAVTFVAWTYHPTATISRWPTLPPADVPNIPSREHMGIVYHPRRNFVFLTQAGSSLIEAYDTQNYTKAKELDFSFEFQWSGGNAFEEGRLRISDDGSLLFCTVQGGIRYLPTGL